MKNTLYLALLCFAFTTATAQQVSDALRYAQEDLVGTARFRAMGGAFGALGGDLSALNVNPAGSAVFINNFASATLTNYNQRNKSNYFGTQTDAKDSSVDLNQLGGVWVFNNYNAESKWSKFTFAMNYDISNNFNNSLYSQGTNPTNSIANYFTSYANGIPSNVLTNNAYDALNYQQQQAYLGVNGELIQSSNGNQYISSVNPNGSYYQENSVETTGYNGKISFNLATEYDNRFYFGANLNAHFTNFRSSSSFYEDYADSPGNNAATGVQASRFTNELYAYGSGFSFQLGAIAKVTNRFRVGLAYESPTWYNLNEELQQILAVNCADCAGRQNDFFAGPNTLFVYPTYNLRTPAKYTGSLAYVFGTSGIISLDYSLRDFSNTKLSPSDEFLLVNNGLNTTLNVSNEVRAGGEYRIKQWSLRGGYRFVESPYKNKRTIGNLNSFSTGLGYSFNTFKLDVAYTYSKRDNNQAFFSQGLTDPASIRAIQNNVTLTLGFDL
jgi:hypothetical protein